MKYFLSIVLISLNIHFAKHDLGLKLKIGETYSQTMVSEANIDQDIMGTSQTMVMEISGKFSFEVKSEKNGVYTTDVQYDYLSLKTTTPFGETLSSSEEGYDDIMSTVLRNMRGKVFTVMLQKNGRIQEIIDLDNLYSDIFNSLPPISEEQKEQIVSQMKQAYGEAAFKGNLEMVTAIFPENEVEKGDKWNTKVKLESGMSGTLDNTYTLSQIEADYILIEGSSKFSTEDKEAYVDVQGMPTKYLLKGDVISSYKIDPETNWTIEAKITQDISGKVEIKDNPNVPGGMEIPMTLTSKITVTNK
ncbi:DUF6263 family protein [Roseivirga sp.]|uniref:DUF6263 family protein n=1 Tax=Roseivirga sp. TaxID=1964215 RepID=UPI003B5235D2